MEAQRLPSALAADENQVAAKAIKLLLAGARRNEVTKARWDYIDFERRTLLVPSVLRGSITANDPAGALADL